MTEAVTWRSVSATCVQGYPHRLSHVGFRELHWHAQPDDNVSKPRTCSTPTPEHVHLRRSSWIYQNPRVRTVWHCILLLHTEAWPNRGSFPLCFFFSFLFSQLSRESLYFSKACSLYSPASAAGYQVRATSFWHVLTQNQPIMPPPPPPRTLPTHQWMIHASKRESVYMACGSVWISLCYSHLAATAYSWTWSTCTLRSQLKKLVTQTHVQSTLTPPLWTVVMDTGPSLTTSQ